MSQRVVITGAAGFIGSHLADTLLHRGYAVVGIDNLLTGDIAATTVSDACPMTITNVAGLRAAAHARLIYIEIERSGLPTVRGQLWPRSIVSPGIRATAGASAQQVVGTEHLPPQWTRGTATLYFSDADEFELVGFHVPYRHRYRSVELRCAAPGQDGRVQVGHQW